MRTVQLPGWTARVAAVVAFAAAGRAADGATELGRFEITEPLGRTWTHEWVMREVGIDTGGRDVPDGRLVVGAGPVLSYYEFKHPMGDRLTDEKWRAMLQSGKAPDRPEWVKSYLRE